jgi:hypothetical protein
MKATPPLLLLAVGRNVRPRKATTIRPKESILHFAVAKLLREHCLETWQWFHIPNGELRDKRTAGKLKQMGLKAGLPDIALIGPTGIFHALELKRQGEDLSDAQENFQLWCIRHNVSHSVAYTFDHALAALGGWGCLRIRLSGAP